jgi:hypothetical protein
MSFQNITLGSQLTDNLIVHNEKLRIADYLLKDFNSRLQLNIQLLYNVSSYNFTLLDSTLDRQDFYQVINRLTQLNLEDDKNEDYRVDNFVNFISLYFENTISTITKPIVDKETVVYFNNERERLIKLYKDFTHLDFLNDESNIRLRKGLNNLCSNILRSL